MVRGQFKIQQMAFMLIAVTVLFVLVGMFALVFKTAGLKGSADELNEKNAQLLVSKLANSPEFSCGDVYDYGEANCVDGDKVMALKQSGIVYEDFWGVSNIEIRKIMSEGSLVCTGSNYPNCDILRVKEGKIVGAYSSNFVVLCNKDDFEGDVVDKCEVARLFVSYEPVG